MAEAALFIGWGEAARGREKQALEVFNQAVQYWGLGFPPNRGGFLYAAPGWMAAIFSYSTGGSKPAELCRRRRL